MLKRKTILFLFASILITFCLILPLGGNSQETVIMEHKQLWGFPDPPKEAQRQPKVIVNLDIEITNETKNISNFRAINRLIPVFADLTDALTTGISTMSSQAIYQGENYVVPDDTPTYFWGFLFYNAGLNRKSEEVKGKSIVTETFLAREGKDAWVGVKEDTEYPIISSFEFTSLGSQKSSVIKIEGYASLAQAYRFTHPALLEESVVIIIDERSWLKVKEFTGLMDSLGNTLKVGDEVSISFLKIKITENGKELYYNVLASPEAYFTGDKIQLKIPEITTIPLPIPDRGLAPEQVIVVGDKKGTTTSNDTIIDVYNLSGTIPLDLTFGAGAHFVPLFNPTTSPDTTSP